MDFVMVAPSICRVEKLDRKSDSVKILWHHVLQEDRANMTNQITPVPDLKLFWHTTRQMIHLHEFFSGS
jgi:hypothetical protein